MPLKRGKSKQVISKNIKELVSKKPSSSRKRAIQTIAKEQGISAAKAKQKQAVAIARYSNYC